MTGEGGSVTSVQMVENSESSLFHHGVFLLPQYAVSLHRHRLYRGDGRRDLYVIQISSKSGLRLGGICET